MGSPTAINVRLVVQGELAATWSAMFAALRVEPGAQGTTLISGELSDQTALHGLLASIRDLGLSLISVEAVAMSESTSQSAAQRPQR